MLISTQFTIILMATTIPATIASFIVKREKLVTIVLAIAILVTFINHFYDYIHGISFITVVASFLSNAFVVSMSVLGIGAIFPQIETRNDIVEVSPADRKSDQAKS